MGVLSVFVFVGMGVAECWGCYRDVGVCVLVCACVGAYGCSGKRAPSPCLLWDPQRLTCPLGLAAELEFVEITIIVVVVMVMVVVITCLLSHYKLSARSFIGRHSQSRRREDALSSVSA